MASTARNASHEAYHPVVQTFIAAMRAVSEMSYDGMCGPHAEHAARRKLGSFGGRVLFPRPAAGGDGAQPSAGAHLADGDEARAHRFRVVRKPPVGRPETAPFARAREEGARALASPRLVVAVRGLEVRLEGSQGDGPVFAAHTPDVAVRAREDGRDRDERRRAVKPHGPLR
jgi:hypothetical protein